MACRARCSSPTAAAAANRRSGGPGSAAREPSGTTRSREILQSGTGGFNGMDVSFLICGILLPTVSKQVDSLQKLTTTSLAMFRYNTYYAFEQCDDTKQPSAINIARDPMKHELTKHIEVDAYYTRAQVQDDVIALRYVPSELQVANFFTTAQTRAQHRFFLSKLSFHDPP
ncbi:uncharacterized protein [Miscanthus floridulus]|uniref:uncharacterized protein isoform X2 n=1 Tax=Miscanthus floridulus TaxID=154761 RepID=UPI00345B46C1